MGVEAGSEAPSCHLVQACLLTPACGSARGLGQKTNKRYPALHNSTPQALSHTSHTAVNRPTPPHTDPHLCEPAFAVVLYAPGVHLGEDLLWLADS